jgi:DNA-binding NarL/FixJ family response regulator
MSGSIRVAVADDHPVVRDGLVAMLKTQSDFQIVGEAGSGREALMLVESAQPEVLLLDLEMPQLDGVEVLRRLRAAGAPTRVIVFTVYDSDERIIAAVESGAVGYLLKGAPRQEVFSAVRTVAAGGSLLAPRAAAAVLRKVRGEPAAKPAAPTLTPREQSVLEYLAGGLGNKQIAARLGIAERTVKFHVSSVFTKLGAGNRAEAVARAVKAKLL